MELIDSGNQSVVILVVASNLAISSQMHYALGILKCTKKILIRALYYIFLFFLAVIVNVEGESPPTRTSSFFLLKNIDFSVFHQDQNLTKINLLVSSQSVYLYNHRYIVSSPGTNIQILRYEFVSVVTKIFVYSCEWLWRSGCHWFTWDKHTRSYCNKSVTCVFFTYSWLHCSHSFGCDFSLGLCE